MSREVHTSPGAVRALKASREAAQPVAVKPPSPPLPRFAPTTTQTAILLALPSSVGGPMNTMAVVLALKSGEPGLELTEAACAEELDALFSAGLVDLYVREAGHARWTRSEDGDGLPMVRARFEVGSEEGR